MPGFFKKLARAKFAPKALSFRNYQTTDGTVAEACRALSLERLEVEWQASVTKGLVDAILGSRTAYTLQVLHVANCASGHNEETIASALTASDLLRLARGCPKLRDIYWEADHDARPHAKLLRADCEPLTELLLSRGAEVTVSPWFGWDDTKKDELPMHLQGVIEDYRGQAETTDTFMDKHTIYNYADADVRYDGRGFFGFE